MSVSRTRTRTNSRLFARSALGAFLAIVFVNAASATSPEEEAGCPIPTLEQCQEPGFLTGELDDPDGPACGLLQSENEWTCYELFLAEAEQYETDKSVYPQDLDSQGFVAEVAEVPQDPEDATATSFEGELSMPAHALEYGTSLFPTGQIITPGGEIQSFAIFSPEPATQLNGPQSFAIQDPRNFWPNNGQGMASCQEYAWELYFDLTKFWFDVATLRHDYLETFEMAFEPGGIGDSHLNGSAFRDITGTIEVLPSAREDVFRNRFFRLPKWPRDPGEPKVPGSPNLRWSLKQYDPEFGVWIVNRVVNAHDKKVTKDMQFYKEHWENLTVEAVVPQGPWFKVGAGGGDGGGDDDDGVSGAVGYALDAGGDDGDGINQYVADGGGDDDGGYGVGNKIIDEGDEDPFPVTGQVPLEFSDGFPMRRHFVAELDELYDLQLEKDRLLNEWASIDKHYEGSGWTIQDLLDELNPEFDDLAIEPRSTPTRPRSEPVDQLAINLDSGEIGSFAYETGDDDGGISGAGSLKGVGPQPDPFGFLTPESAARKRVLDGLLAVYQEAKDAGCLYDWVTPCDFSTKEFALEAISHAVKEQQEAYVECIGLLPSPFWQNLGQSRAVIDLLSDLGELSSEYHELTGETLDDFIASDADAEALGLYDDLQVLAGGCVLQVPETMTADDLRDLAEDTSECLAKVPEYRTTFADFAAKVKEHAALEQAKARLAEIPELLDPDTGELRRPGRSESWSELKGTKYFGLEMGYEYKFDTDIGPDLCSFDLSAGGEFKATAKVLTASIDLVDAAAWVKTGQETVDIHAEVFGIALFDAIEESGFDEDLTVDLSIGDPVEYETGTDVGFETNFFLGPIPMSIKVGVGGKVGFRAETDGELVLADLDEESVSLCPSLTMGAKFGPFVSVYGFVEFALDIFIAEAGIRGELVIVSVDLPVFVEMGISAQSAGDELMDLSLSVGMGVGLKLTTLAGNVKVYAELGPCPLCKRVSKTLAKWDGFTFDKKLFEHRYEVSVGDLVLALTGGN